MKPYLFYALIAVLSIGCQPKATQSQTSFNNDMTFANQPYVSTTSNTRIKNADATSASLVLDNGIIRSADQIASLGGQEGRDYCLIPKNSRIYLSSTEPIRQEQGHNILYISKIVVPNTSSTEVLNTTETKIEPSSTYQTSSFNIAEDDVMTKNLKCVEAKNKAKAEGVYTTFDCVAFSRGEIELLSSLKPFYDSSTPNNVGNDNGTPTPNPIATPFDNQIATQQSNDQEDPTPSNINTKTPENTVCSYIKKAYVDKNAVQLNNITIAKPEFDASLGARIADKAYERHGLSYSPTSRCWEETAYTIDLAICGSKLCITYPTSPNAPNQGSAFRLLKLAQENPKGLCRVTGYLLSPNRTISKAPNGSIIVYDRGACGYSAESGHVEIKNSNKNLLISDFAHAPYEEGSCRATASGILIPVGKANCPN